MATHWRCCDKRSRRRIVLTSEVPWRYEVRYRTRFNDFKVSLVRAWPRPWDAAPSATLAGRVIVGIVFIIGGLVKIGSPAVTVVAVRAYEILPLGAATLWAYATPTLEILLGVMLIIGLATRMAAAIAGLLLLAFLGGIAAAWARGLSIDCGCFGGGGRVVEGTTQYPLELLRDAGLLALAVVVIARPPGKFAVDGLLRLWPARPRTPRPDSTVPAGTPSERRAEGQAP